MGHTPLMSEGGMAVTSCGNALLRADHVNRPAFRQSRWGYGIGCFFLVSVKHLDSLPSMQVGALKDTLGFNMAAMRHLARTSQSANAVMGGETDAVRQPSKRLRDNLAGG